MASIRGILNIQSLNELTSENNEYPRKYPSNGFKRDLRITRNVRLIYVSCSSILMSMAVKRASGM